MLATENQFCLGGIVGQIFVEIDLVLVGRMIDREQVFVFNAEFAPMTKLTDLRGSN